MAMLMLASSTHSMPAAIHSVGESRHEEQRHRGQHGARQEIRPAPPEPVPGAIGHVADDGLHQQAGERRRDPQARDLIDLGAERLEDPADVGVLQREAELDAEESETHVPDLPERHLRPPGRG